MRLIALKVFAPSDERPAAVVGCDGVEGGAVGIDQPIGLCC